MNLESNVSTLASKGKDPTRNLEEMREYWRRLGHSLGDLRKLNAIHITGTKGKGSTAAFTSSILSRLGLKTGLFTSPHLVQVRERIRINGRLMPKETFARYFFECYSVFDQATPSTKDAAESIPKHPAYFRFLTLMAYHIFLKEKVDAAVIEVGIGGEYDATNILEGPVVTVVTSLGLDHQATLGPTIKDIAWNKSGIFKRDAVAITTAVQPADGLTVLRKRALARGVQLAEISPNDVQDIIPLSNVRLGIGGRHQLLNAALAVKAAEQWYLSVKREELSSATKALFQAGLEETVWFGRSQVYHDPVVKNLEWYLDGAHTMESIQTCMEWLVTVFPRHPRSKCILMFNCTRSRDFDAILKAIHTQADAAGIEFQCVFFPTNTTFSDGTFLPDLYNASVDTKDLSVQNACARTWKSIHPRSECVVKESISETVSQIRRICIESDQDVFVFVTGSLHLVGGTLAVTGFQEV